MGRMSWSMTARITSSADQFALAQAGRQGDRPPTPTEELAGPAASTAPAAGAREEHPAPHEGPGADTSAQSGPAGAELPAGMELPPPQPRPPGFRERGRMRRRIRFLSKARELAYRDLGGLVFEMQRLDRRNDELVAAKLEVLAGFDTELRTLESALEERRAVVVLREAGIAACPRCAAIHGSDDRFCPMCGMPLGRRAEVPIAATPQPGTPPSPNAPAAANAPPAPPASATPNAPASGAFSAPGAPSAPSAPAAGVPLASSAAQASSA